MESRRLTRWLKPLARLERLTWAINLLVMAGMLTLGYTIGAFTGTSPHPTLMTTGTIQINVQEKNAASTTNAGIVEFTNTQPGQTQQNTVAVVNSGSLPFTYSVRATIDANANNAALFDAIQVAVKLDGAKDPVYSGPLNKLASQPIAQVEPGQASNVQFTVWLPETADNKLMGKSGTATFFFDAMQTGLPKSTE